MSNFQTFLKKQLNYDSVFSAPELSNEIKEQAFNTSALLQNMNLVQAQNPSFRNVFVTHPSISDVVEGGVIPDSTTQIYTTTQASFSKIATNIPMTTETVDFAKKNIEENTAQLVGSVQSDKIAQLVVTDLAARETLTPDRAVGEDLLYIASGFAIGWGTDLDTIDLFKDSAKLIPSVYDATAKVFMNKNNFHDFQVIAVQDVHLIKNNMLLDRYEVVLCDQLGDETIYFGSMPDAFDVVSLPSVQTVDETTQPDVIRVIDSAQYAVAAKDTYALVVLRAVI